MKTVLFVSPTGHIGGAERNLMLMCTTLPQYGYRPLVLGPAEGPLPEFFRSNGITYIPWATSGLQSGMIFRVLWNVILLAFKLRKYSVDIIHSNSIFCIYVAVYLGVIMRKPVLIHWADFDTRLGDIRLVQTFRSRVTVISVSQAIDHTLLNAGIPRENMSLLYYGIDSPTESGTASRQDIARRYGVNPNAVWIGVTGRIDTWKGQRYAIEAIAQVTHPVQLILLGDEITASPTPLLPELKALAQQLGIADRVCFTGHVDDPAEVVRHFDIVLCPSDYEPFGLVAIEAMALGLPVVASDTGGFQESVENGTTGVLVTPKNGKAIATALAPLLSDPARRHTMGQAGKARFDQLFRKEIHFAKLKALYETINGA
jgi:glycosyltransferase involved in cell wall biosynthesis